MNRSWVALGIVALLIVGVVVYEVAFRGRGETPPAEPAAQVVSPKPSSAEPAGTKTPTEKEEPAKPPEVEKPKEPTEPPKKGLAPQKAEGPGAGEVLTKAQALIKQDKKQEKKVEAQKLLSDALSQVPKPANAEAIKKLLTGLGDELLFSPKGSPLILRHPVAKGEALEKIAKQHKTTMELIQHLNPEKIKKLDHIEEGWVLKVLPHPFDVEVTKSQCLLTVYWQGLWVREFPVAVGKDTPEGQFKAANRMKDPHYTAKHPPVMPSDHKANPLGTHWITLVGAGDGKIGIHGTWEPETIGKPVSQGCVRMHNKDVEWLFNRIVEGESKISIKP